MTHFPDDFREFLEALRDRQVRFKDLDVWVEVNPDNAERIVAALRDFGMGSLGLTPQDFLADNMVVQLGYELNRIDLLTTLDGVTFSEAYPRRVILQLADYNAPVIDLETPDGLTESMRKRPRSGTLSVCDNRKCHRGRSPTLPSRPDSSPDGPMERHPQRADSRLDDHWPAAFPAQHPPSLAAAHPLQRHLRPEHRTSMSSVAGESSHRLWQHLRSARDPCPAGLGPTHPDPRSGHQRPL
ncbi:hypothetical protein [Deinococcus sp. PEB2-63]